jgi:hypothetical protein
MAMVLGRQPALTAQPAQRRDQRGTQRRRVSAQLACRLDRGTLAESLDNFQRDVTEQIGGRPETTQALEFGDFADDAVEADAGAISPQLTENRSTTRCCLRVLATIRSAGHEQFVEAISDCGLKQPKNRFAPGSGLIRTARYPMRSPWRAMSGTRPSLQSKRARQALTGDRHSFVGRWVSMRSRSSFTRTCWPRGGSASSRSTAACSRAGVQPHPTSP